MSYLNYLRGMNTTCDYPLAGLSVKLRHETHAAGLFVKIRNRERGGGGGGRVRNYLKDSNFNEAFSLDYINGWQGGPAFSILSIF